MSNLRTYAMPNSTVLRINSDRDFIEIDPYYQRRGDIWTLEKKQLLIDSILNEYDIPKLYFHVLTREYKKTLNINKDCDYAIVDGRQRLEAVWNFMDGSFSLSDDFEYFADSTVNAKGLTYENIAKEYPKLKIRFDSYILPITLIDTEDVELIEDMFSRLNEAVPLNAAEKRNALGGNIAKLIRDIANHEFFRTKVSFNDKRFQYREVSARLIFLEYSMRISKKIIDTKKPYLDKMVIDNRDSNIDSYYYDISVVLDTMNNVFSLNDSLLRSQSIIVVYYLVFKEAIEKNLIHKVLRQNLFSFFSQLNENRKMAGKDITLANFDYLEFDRMSQQGTNDATSIRERTRILSEYLGTREPQQLTHTE